MYPKLIKSKIKLTIGMLVSNHVQYIRKCMEALKPLLDAVPSELVVIDTKGEATDGSIDIVREYTDKIYRFEWCNDFSAARNFCLEHANGEWFLYQDDDEWFDDVQEFIDFFTSGESEEYYSGYYYTRDYAANGSYSMGIAGRMIRRTEETRFIGRVHETFNEVYAPNKLFSCFTHHMGYVFVTEESRRAHQERNLSILKEEIKEKGYTPRLCAQTVQELLQREATAPEGFTFAQECIPKLMEQGEIMDSCSQWIIASFIRHYSVTGEYEKMIAQANLVNTEYPLTQMTKLVLAAVLVREAAAREDLPVITENVPVFLENWDWLRAHEEEALIQTQMDFPRYYSEEYFLDIVRVGALVANRQGKFRLANEYWRRLPLKRAGFDATPYMQGMQQTMTGLKKQELQQVACMIEEAINVIKEIILSGGIGSATELLATMQEAVIAYGNKAEQYFGENKERDSVLEQCCELLWKTSNAQSAEEALRLFENAVGFFGRGKQIGV